MEQQHAALLRTIIIGTFVIGALFAVVGVWLVYLSASGTNDIRILGQTINTDNTGVAALFLGTVTVILLIRQTLKTISAPQSAASPVLGGAPSDGDVSKSARPGPHALANEFGNDEETWIKVRSPLAPEVVINRISRISPNQRRVLRTMLLANGAFDRLSVAKKLALEYVPTEDTIHEITMPVHCVRLNMDRNELSDRLRKLEDLSLVTTELWSVLTYSVPQDVVYACNDHIGRIVSLLFPKGENFVPVLGYSSRLIGDEWVIFGTRTDSSEDTPVSGTFWMNRNIQISKLVDGKVVERVTPPGAHQFYKVSRDDL